MTQTRVRQGGPRWLLTLLAEAMIMPFPGGAEFVHRNRLTRRICRPQRESVPPWSQCHVAYVDHIGGLSFQVCVRRGAVTGVVEAVWIAGRGEDVADRPVMHPGQVALGVRISQVSREVVDEPRPRAWTSATMDGSTPTSWSNTRRKRGGNRGQLRRIAPAVALMGATP